MNRIKNVLKDSWMVLVPTIGVIVISMIVSWYGDSIHNPSNAAYVVEVAFNLGIPVDSVTQEQFDDRYGQ